LRGASLGFISNKTLLALLFIINTRKDRNQDKNSEENLFPK
jgi:hypothetical protein